jgi:hypothetical protein
MKAMQRKGAEEARNQLTELLEATSRASRPSSPGMAGQWWR